MTKWDRFLNLVRTICAVGSLILAALIYYRVYYHR